VSSNPSPAKKKKKWKKKKKERKKCGFVALELLPQCPPGFQTQTAHDCLYHLHGDKILILKLSFKNSRNN
jgi:hypothetical protein